MAEQYYALELIREPTEIWKTLLGLACQDADTVEFVVSKDITKWPSELVGFLPLVVDLFTSKWRWQNKQLRQSVHIRFQVTPQVCAYLQRIQRLEEWVGHLPEDPSFYRNGQAFLWTISHDGMAFLWLSDNQATEMQNQGYKLQPIDNNSSPTRKEEP